MGIIDNTEEVEGIRAAYHRQLKTEVERYRAALERIRDNASTSHPHDLRQIAVDALAGKELH